jgi:hypothetical protein
LGTAFSTASCGKMTPIYTNLTFSSGMIGFITDTRTSAGTLTSANQNSILATTPTLVSGVYTFEIQFDMLTTTNINNRITYGFGLSVSGGTVNDKVFQGRITTQRYTDSFSYNLVVSSFSYDLVASILRLVCNFAIRNNRFC